MDRPRADKWFYATATSIFLYQVAPKKIVAYDNR